MEPHAIVETHTCVSALNDTACPARPRRRKYASLHRAGNGFCLLLLLLLATQSFAQSGLTSVVELIGTKPLATDKLLALCRQNGVPTSSVYRWQNHLVAYGPAASIKKLQQPLKTAYQGATVKLYDAPFYQFDRQRCTDKTTAKQWDNIVLTANLVKDEAKQREYLQYHATQFEKWPEVSNGFCNASFQQLLVFRQGRQLMLVISIPKGASLDELNPRTTQNNPRVDDWNALMKQYQEGIAGTKPGETWVFLQPVSAIQLRPQSTTPQPVK
jgi:hypothetical protein